MSWYYLNVTAHVFAALLWLGGMFFLATVGAPVLPGLSDAGIAIIGALLMFVIPAKLPEAEFLLDWRTAARLPWDVLILFGGGLSLAGAISGTGFSDEQIIAQIDGLLLAVEEACNGRFQLQRYAQPKGEVVARTNG